MTNKDILFGRQGSSRTLKTLSDIKSLKWFYQLNVIGGWFWTKSHFSGSVISENFGVKTQKSADIHSFIGGEE